MLEDLEENKNMMEISGQPSLTEPPSLLGGISEEEKKVDSGAVSGP